MDWIWAVIGVFVLAGIGMFVLPFLPIKRDGKNSVDIESWLMNGGNSRRDGLVTTDVLS